MNFVINVDGWTVYPWAEEMQCYKLDLREAGKGQAMGLSPRGSVAVLAGKDKFEVIGLTVDGGSSEWGEEWVPSVTRKTHGHRYVHQRILTDKGTFPYS